MVVDDGGGGGYYSNFSEVGLISLGGPVPFGSWFLMLSFICESKRWYLMKQTEFKMMFFLLQVLKSGSFCMFLSDIDIMLLR